MPPPPAAPRSLVVVGGGISGLAAARALRVRAPHASITLIEQAADVGGKLRVGEVGGLPVDEGAESLLARRPEGLRLARQVGLEADLVHPATTAAQVWSRGCLRPLPPTLLGVPVDLRALAASTLLGPRELARVPLDLVLPGGALPGEDVPVGRYVAARLGRAVVDRLVEPLLGGVYAGSADALSFAAAVPQLAALAQSSHSLLVTARRARAEGSRRHGNAPVFASLRGGLGRLPGAVAAALSAEGVTMRTRTAVRELQRQPRGWRLVLGSTDPAGPAGVPELLDADAVVLALPAAPAGRLLSGVAPAVAAEVAGIEYAGVGLVTLVYPPDAFPVPLPGSGFLVPPVEGRIAKAATFSTSKWGWYAQASPDRVAVRLSVGRHGEQADLQRADAELVALVAGELAEAVGVRGAPLATRVTRWDGSLPQYAVGHLDRVRRIRGGLAPMRGLAVCGAAYDGVGVPACIASGEAAADRLAAELDEQPAEVPAAAGVGENGSHG